MESIIIEKCPHCGASMKKYWHRITNGLAKSLVKAYSLVCSKGVNVFDKKELQLTHSEYGNFQKLRFHGLIAKHRVNGEWHKGEWLITSRGADFLKGNIRIPVRVQTFRNKVTDHAEDYVAIRDVIGVEPYWETEPDFTFANVEDGVNVAEVLFTKEGQGILV